jgi:hypothetical protein
MSVKDLCKEKQSISQADANYQLKHPWPAGRWNFKGKREQLGTVNSITNDHIYHG